MIPSIEKYIRLVPLVGIDILAVPDRIVELRNIPIHETYRPLAIDIHYTADLLEHLPALILILANKIILRSIDGLIILRDVLQVVHPRKVVIALLHRQLRKVN